ncbi:hypothetical protein FHS31_002245 [Sphingomonas vulcanisoli]|uniref:Uncharacterized protein n=1 Tax=Sphingomonas vulcanisoli TaxID=1658060 RepID=A0ABX0TVB5_9SPHN|nr:hypothetical protein [Sphingomonas vulcanisoli]NIJ08624.1 hypothetical protein [Sphingomonas vulcanisoli]
MGSLVAKSFVLVALCSPAVPAFADAPISGAIGNGSVLSDLDVGDRHTEIKNYWTASSEYYVSTPGRGAVSASAPRRVLITGYHPVEGFEAEILAEAANRAAHTAHP